MKTVVLLTFDHYRSRDPIKPYALYCLQTYLKTLNGYGKEFISFPISIPMSSIKDPNDFYTIQSKIDKICPIHSLHYLAIGDYVWCTDIIEPFLKHLKSNGWRGISLVGGYEVTTLSEAELNHYKPEVDFILKGYAEKALEKIIMNSTPLPRILCESIDPNILPSPYLNNEIEIYPNCEMIRWETKRGCLYNCSFCECRNSNKQQILEFPISRIKEELYLFKTMNIKKVNVLDSIFHTGSYYMEILEEMIRIPQTQFSIQARFEALDRPDEFLSLCSKGNIYLEFGVQSINKTELKNLGRPNNTQAIENILRLLKKYRIPYETNLIFGIPGQTVKTFRESIRWLRKRGNKNIKCFPLRIPKGSPLNRLRETYNVQESVEDGAPIVKQTSSFTEQEHDKMMLIAGGLSFEHYLEETVRGKSKKIQNMKWYTAYISEDEIHWNWYCSKRKIHLFSLTYPEFEKKGFHLKAIDYLRFTTISVNLMIDWLLSKPQKLFFIRIPRKGLFLLYNYDFHFDKNELTTYWIYCDHIFGKQKQETSRAKIFSLLKKIYFQFMKKHH